MYVSGTTMGPGGEGVEADRREGLARARDPLGPFTWIWSRCRDAWSSTGTRRRPTGSSTTSALLPDPANSGNVVDRLVAPDRLAGDLAPSPPVPAVGGRRRGRALLERGRVGDGAEGPVHQMYSGGFYREATYGIGTAWADDPRGRGRRIPPTPSSRAASGSRPGHHCVVLAPDGVTPYAVYHAYDGGRPGRKVHLDRLFWCGDRPRSGTARRPRGPSRSRPGPCTTRPWRTGTPSGGRAARATRCARATRTPRRRVRPSTSHLDDPAIPARCHSGRGAAAARSRWRSRCAARRGSAGRRCAATATATRCCAAPARRRDDPGRRGRRRLRLRGDRR